MTRPRVISIVVAVTVLLAAALWVYWPVEHRWGPVQAPPEGDLLVVFDLSPAPLPPIPLPDGPWHPMRLELDPGPLETAGAELADQLRQLERPGRRIALLAMGAAGWIAIEALLEKAPVTHLILVSPSATGGCAHAGQLDRMPLRFRLATRGIDLRERLRTLVIPTLIVTGADLKPDEARCIEEIALLVAGARLERIPGAGVEAAGQAPVEVGARIREFLP